MCTRIYLHYAQKKKKIRQANYANLARRMGVDFHIYQNLVMLEWPELSERKKERKKTTNKEEKETQPNLA